MINSLEIDGKDIQLLIDKKVMLAYENHKTPIYCFVTAEMYAALLKHWSKNFRYAPSCKVDFDYAGATELQYHSFCGAISIRRIDKTMLNFDYADVVCLDEDAYHELLLEREFFSNEDSVLRRQAS